MLALLFKCPALQYPVVRLWQGQSIYSMAMEMRFSSLFLSRIGITQALKAWWFSPVL